MCNDNNNNNNKNGNGSTGDKVDDDGNDAMVNNVDNNGDGAMGDRMQQQGRWRRILRLITTVLWSGCIFFIEIIIAHIIVSK